MRLLLISLLVTTQCTSSDSAAPGSARVVTRGDTVVRIDTVGRDSNGARITRNTPMRVASLSKSFTAAAVLTLVDEGRVALDSPVVAYLPEFHMADSRASAITVRQLLNQTSGLSDRTIDIAATRRSATLTEYVASLANARLAAAPGTHWEYCNVNYDVAARLVEVADAHPFAEAMLQRVFRPLGMARTFIAAQDRDENTLPLDGYISVFGFWVPRRELPAFRGGAGGVVTTAADMGRWLISQTGHGPQILSATSLRDMHTPGASAGNYAMGWGVEHAVDRTLLVHSGNLFTYTAVQAIDVATGDGWAVLTNSASLVDPTYDQLLAVVSGSKAPTDTRPYIEGALGVVALGAVLLGARGVRRARRPRPKWRLLPPLIPIALFATCPQWISLLMNGREVTWAQMTYFPAPLTITLGVMALSGMLTFIARVRWMQAARRRTA